MIRAALTAAFFLASFHAAGAGPLRLAFPLECTLGENCFIQQYVDNDPGPGFRDFTCGYLSYDGHKGTDIRVAHRREIQGDGVKVLAAAPGRVLGTRNSMEDIAQGESGSPDVSSVECGNGVVLDHGDGWRTQYCHMRKGSVTVRSGQTVKTGDVLGKMGLSGMTQFPHLHIKVTRSGAVVDPFRPNGGSECGDATTDQLWSDPTRYTPGGILAAEFSPSPLDYSEVIEGPNKPISLDAQAQALILWTFLFGVQAGDTIRFTIIASDGATLAQKDVIAERNRAQEYRYIGRKRAGSDWQAGRYIGVVELLRNGKTIDKHSAGVDLN